MRFQIILSIIVYHMSKPNEPTLQIVAQKTNPHRIDQRGGKRAVGSISTTGDRAISFLIADA
jgi:hypothetical protein